MIIKISESTLSKTVKWEEIADIKDELAERDWFMGTSGNLAIRTSNHPIEFLVTASGKDKRKRTDEDFLLVDAHGNPLENTHLKPSAETLLHCKIYEKTNANCSLHVHTIANNLISDIYADEGEIIFQGQEIIKAFGLWEEDAILKIPIVENYAHIPTLAEAFIPYLTEDYGAVLIKNHGITAWGRNGFEAKKILEASEFLFQYTLAKHQLKR